MYLLQENVQIKGPIKCLASTLIVYGNYLVFKQLCYKLIDLALLLNCIMAYRLRK